MSKKNLFTSIIIIFILSNFIAAKITDEDPDLQAPKKVIVLSSKFNEHGMVSLTVVDLKNNELVLLSYDYFPDRNFGKKELRSVIRTGINIDLKLQKRVNIDRYSE